MGWIMMIAPIVGHSLPPNETTVDATPAPLREDITTASSRDGEAKARDQDETREIANLVHDSTRNNPIAAPHRQADEGEVPQTNTTSSILIVTQSLTRHPPMSSAAEVGVAVWNVGDLHLIIRNGLGV